MKIKNSILLQLWDLSFLLRCSTYSVPYALDYHMYVYDFVGDTYACSPITYLEIKQLQNCTLLGIIYGKELSNN
jgi:hypothetical protein